MLLFLFVILIFVFVFVFSGYNEYYTENACSLKNKRFILNDKTFCDYCNRVYNRNYKC